MAMAKNIAVNMLTGDNPHGSPAEALAWATLELAEQQRIANLIALADFAHDRFGTYAGEAGGMGVLFTYGETLDSNIRLRGDIREALGLA